MVFCEEHGSYTKLVHQKVKQIAEETHDTKILAYVSEGDMIAIEVKYNCKCLLFYYSKASSVNSLNMQHVTKTICGIVLEANFFVRAVFLIFCLIL